MSHLEQFGAIWSLFHKQTCEPLSLRRFKVLKTSQVSGSAISEWHRCEPLTPRRFQWPKLRTSSIALSECRGTVLLPACSLGPASQCWPCTGLLSYTTQGEEKLCCQVPSDIVSSSCCSRAWNSSRRVKPYKSNFPPKVRRGRKHPKTNPYSPVAQPPWPLPANDK